MPDGELEIVPLPDLVKLSVKVDKPNDAVTDWLLLIEITQGPVPEHAPPHPKKLKPVFGVSVRVTEVPAANVAEHLVPLDWVKVAPTV